jgi:L-aspartate oxidase
MRHVRNIDLHQRFPGISASLATYGLDLARDLIPVGPAAHYLMGGIRTDLAGRTSLGGLYAAGETACTGVHGANRLASNSLLEGLVFGARSARSMLSDRLPIVHPGVAGDAPKALSPSEEKRVESIISKLQSAMWAHAGLLRDEQSLREGVAIHTACESQIAEIAASGKGGRRLEEAQAISGVARAVLHSALARQESRGAHFRNDFPRRDDENFCRHSVYGRDRRVRFENW